MKLIYTGWTNVLSRLFSPWIAHTALRSSYNSTLHICSQPVSVCMLVQKPCSNVHWLFILLCSQHSPHSFLLLIELSLCMCIAHILFWCLEFAEWIGKCGQQAPSHGNVLDLVDMCICAMRRRLWVQELHEIACFLLRLLFFFVHFQFLLLYSILYRYE